MSIKQLLSRAGYTRSIPLSTDTNDFISLYNWFTLPSSEPFDVDPSELYPPTFTSYFAAAFAYARGSTRFSSIPFTNTTFQEVTLEEDSRAYGTGLFSATGYISEIGPLHFTVPYYSNKSRTRITANQPLTARLACRTAYSSQAARLSTSAGDDAQLGYFLGAPPCMRVPSVLDTVSPFRDWNPSGFSVPVAVPTPLQTESLIKVHDALGNPKVVTTDSDGAFTVFRSGVMAWAGPSWTKVSGNTTLAVVPPNPTPVTLPDNTPVIIRGLNSVGTPQTFAAIPNVNGNHTLPVLVHGVEATTTNVRTIGCLDILQGSDTYNLATASIQ